MTYDQNERNGWLSQEWDVKNRFIHSKQSHSNIFYHFKRPTTREVITPSLEIVLCFKKNWEVRGV